MFITVVYVIFLTKLRWAKNKSLYEHLPVSFFLYFFRRFVFVVCQVESLKS